MWLPDVPVWEIATRTIVVFLFLLLILRLSGKRDVGEMSPADLILILLISANVHTSLSGNDKSLTGGLIGAAVLMALNHILNRFAYRSRRFERILKGHPEIVIYDGKPRREIMDRHSLSEMLLKIAIRKEGLKTFDEVHLAVLEPDGTISVFKREEKSAPVSEESLA